MPDVEPRRRRRRGAPPRAALQKRLLLLLLLGATTLLAACGSGEATLKVADDTAEGDLETELDESGDSDATAPADTSADLELDGLGPVPVPSWPTTPAAARSDAEACQAWLESEPAASVPFEPASGCEAGTLSVAARTDAMQRINFYRWLVGAPLVAEALGYLAPTQACAFYQGSNGLAISHEPDPSRPCYSSVASELAAISNLAGGVGTVSEAIDLFTTDTAHRSLLLAPGLLETAAGFYEGVACQVIFGDNWSWDPPFHQTLAFPAPGPNPQPPTTLFTLLPATGHSYGAAIAATVTVGGAAAEATVTLAETGYGTDVLEIRLAQLPPAQTPITVSVTGIETSAGPVAESYTVRFVSCE